MTDKFQIHLVVDSATGQLSDSPRAVDPATDLKARYYLAEHGRLIPPGDAYAIIDHARELYRIGVTREWAHRWLVDLCKLWGNSERHRFIGKYVAHAFDIEERLQLPRNYLHDKIEPTPYQWIDPKKIPQREWLYKPMYIRQFISLTAATGGTGKTSLGLTENAAIVTGKPLLEVEPGARDLRAWYWNGEDPADEMQRRWAAVVKRYGLTRAELDGRFFLNFGRDMPIKIAALEDGKSTISAPVVEELIYAIRHYEIDVFNVDPFVSCHSVTENDTAAMQGVAEQWAHIANEANCSIPLWHHTRKTRGADATIEDSRGASALIGAARGRRVLNKMTAKEAESANLAPEDASGYFWADCSLSSMVPPAEARQWFRLESVNLGNGEVGDGDEVGVAVAWEHPGNGAPDLTEEQDEAAFRAIREGENWRADSRSDQWIGVPIGKAIGLNPESKAHRKQVTSLIKDWTDQNRLETFEGHDKNRNKRTCIRAV